VRGNHDRACCGNWKFDDHFNSAARYAISWTGKMLSEENVRWLSRLPRGPVRPPGRRVTCVHGSPRDEDEYVLSKSAASDALRATCARIILCGHSHGQFGIVSNRRGLAILRPTFQSSNDAAQFELSLHKSSRYLLNPVPLVSPAIATGVRHSPSTTTRDLCSHGTVFRISCGPRKCGSGEPDFQKPSRPASGSVRKYGRRYPCVWRIRRCGT
jgi:hypothetical protein